MHFHLWNQICLPYQALHANRFLNTGNYLALLLLEIIWQYILQKGMRSIGSHTSTHHKMNAYALDHIHHVPFCICFSSYRSGQVPQNAILATYSLVFLFFRLFYILW